MIGLVCALCMYSPRGGKAKPAITILNGYAVCEDHLGYVAQGTDWYLLYRAVQNAERPEPKGSLIPHSTQSDIRPKENR